MAMTSHPMTFDRHWLSVAEFESVVFGVKVCDGARVLLSQAMGVVHHQFNFQLVLKDSSMTLLDYKGNVRVLNKSI